MIHILSTVYNVLQRLKDALSWSGREPAETSLAETRFYSDSEIASIQQQRREANAVVREVAAQRQYKLHPKVAAARAGR